MIAAENLGRRWAGVEISEFALDLIQERRLSDMGVTAEIESILVGTGEAKTGG